ncbi:hypothetical protein, partial [Pseudoalteromonas sp. SIMBA_162]|uniref:hypothetical protein n=1 Tax=Pseudoalteromonas sp. SIMBA_162 TaxID=3080867 RepID=UPI00397865A2
INAFKQALTGKALVQAAEADCRGGVITHRVGPSRQVSMSLEWWKALASQRTCTLKSAGDTRQETGMLPTDALTTSSINSDYSVSA